MSHARSLLKKHKAHVLAKIRTIEAHAVVNPAAGKVPVLDGRQLAQLHTTLATLGHQAGHGTVGQGLAHAATSVAKLEAAQAAKTGKEKQALLLEGLHALTAAHKAAKHAGNEWAI